jgi:hypothetical protein
MIGTCVDWKIIVKLIDKNLLAIAAKVNSEYAEKKELIGVFHQT